MPKLLPPPQRPPNEREAALIAAIRAYADEVATSDEARIDKIEGLRNIAVDVEALWEEALADAKEQGTTWFGLIRGLGLAKATLQDRVTNRPAQKVAAEARESRNLDPQGYHSRQKRSARGRARLASAEEVQQAAEPVVRAARARGRASAAAAEHRLSETG